MADRNRSKPSKTNRQPTDPPTDRFPAFQRPIDEFFTDWPTEEDNQAADRESRGRSR